MQLRGLLFQICYGMLYLGILVGCSDNRDGFQPPPSPTTTSPPLPRPPEVLSLSSPARITSFDTDHLLVSDYESNNIYIVDKTTLQPTAKIKVAGKSTGIAMADGIIFVGNRTLRSVDAFDLSGTFLYHLGSGKAQFQQINDVDVDTEQKLVYALDTKNKCIKRFKFDGSPVIPDIGIGTLQQPTAMTVDPSTGNILVSDFGAPRKINDSAIYTFDNTGRLISIRSGKSGMSGFIFSAPQGSAINAGGIFYLVDSGLCQIFVYTPAVSSPVTLGARGTNNNELNYPLDIFLDEPTGDLFVTDYYNRRITVFRGGGLTP